MRSHQYASPRLVADGVSRLLAGDQRSYLMHVRGYVDHLFAVVGSIRSLARTARQGQALELSDVSVRELMADVHALLEPYAVREGVSLVVECEHAPAVVRGERAALLWVLVNLAGNAVRSTPRGGRVSLSAVALPDAVELRVVDTGSGVPSGRLDAIFERVVVADTTVEVERRGAGLGLFMARDLTRLMGAELFVRNTVGVGSQVAVRFGGVRRAPQR
jgi:signal transduction histidine kinase